MTSPGFDITELVPSRYKAWVGAVSSLLAFVVPYILTVTDSLPQPWPALVGVVIAGLTWVGIYRAPFKPTSDAVLVHPSQVTAPAPAAPSYDIKVNGDPGVAQDVIQQRASGDYQNPWRQ